MTKRYTKQLNSFKYKGEPVKITLGTLILIVLCILLLIIATFTQITIKHPYIPLNIFDLSEQYGGSLTIHNFIKTYRYIPQIPVVFFIIAFLGRKFGILTILGYIILGMFFPFFALGGGISYIFEYGFGYILAFIPTVFLSGTLLKIRKDFIRIVFLSILGVLTIHIIGILYMLLIANLQHAPADITLNWICSQSGVQVIYDIFFSILAVYAGKFAKKIFWIIMC